MFGTKKRAGIVDPAMRKLWQRDYNRSQFVERMFDEANEEDPPEGTDPYEIGISSQERARRLARLR